MHAVTLKNIDKSFGPVHILRKLSLDIEAGEFIVLLGSSGCGKSTLLSIIAGLDDPTEGSVIFGERDVTDLSPKDRDIAMVFQSYALYPTMTVRNNMAFGLRMAKVPEAEIAERLNWAAAMLHLTDYLDRKPAQLSGGQRQRVAIGRAIVRKAKVYLFDEPLSNLDAKLRAEMRLEIKRLHQQLGATMIYVTHDQIEAMTMATRVALMREGRVEQYATPAEIYNRPASRYVAEFVGSPQINVFEGQLADQQGAAVLQVPGGPTLSVPPERLGGPVGAARTVQVGLRPEHLAFGESEVLSLLLSQAEVEVIEFTGADAMVWVNAVPGTGNARLCVRVPAATAPKLGERVNVRADPMGLSLFDRETGQRI